MRTEVGLGVYQLWTLIYAHVNIWKEHHRNYSVGGTQVHHQRYTAQLLITKIYRLFFSLECETVKIIH